jgi:hypothetical protein
MSKNKNLQNAKIKKNDEFYTQRHDIENELTHYSKHFFEKTVYCNCDDPVSSEFWQFFVRNFKAWGLKKLISTHYEQDEKNYAYKLELTKNISEDSETDICNEPTITQIPSNGDFRSACCIDLLKEADIVVTNPPFSLITEFILQLIEYGKKFLIIAPFSAICRKEIFELFQQNKIWLGYGFEKGNAYFRIPKEAISEYAKGVYDPETGLVKFRNCTWITNMDIPKRHQIIDLRGNYYNEALYPKYYNYDGIDVAKIADIPSDFYGYMGVPITFMEQYNPDQFEIIGRGNDIDKKYKHESINGEIIVYKDNKNNIVWSTSYTVKERKIGNSLRIDKDGIPDSVPYSRIIIRRKI